MVYGDRIWVVGIINNSGKFFSKIKGDKYIRGVHLLNIPSPNVGEGFKPPAKLISLVFSKNLSKILKKGQGRGIKMKKFFLFFLLILTFFHTGFAKGTGFTEEDRERLIRLEATLQTFMKQVDKRFEQVDKRFEDMNRRFEELREDMNKRFEQVDKRFEDMNKRFEQVDRRFEEQSRLFRWIVGVLAGIVIAFVVLLVWDRRTAVRVAIREYEEELDRMIIRVEEVI